MGCSGLQHKGSDDDSASIRKPTRMLSALFQMNASMLRFGLTEIVNIYHPHAMPSK